MPRYNHAVTIAFEVWSDAPDGEDLTPAMLKAALFKRIADLGNRDEWLEACLPPYDTEDSQKGFPCSQSQSS
jgi:hypothetical protein